MLKFKRFYLPWNLLEATVAPATAVPARNNGTLAAEKATRTTVGIIDIERC